MLTYIRSLGIAPFLAVLLLVFPVQSWSQGLPEGVEVQVVAEYSVTIPGIEKVQLRKVTLQPGAILENIPVNDTDFCSETQGTLTVVDHKNGTTTLYAAGSRWAPEKGITATISNAGDVPAVMWVYRLIEKK